MCKIVQPNEKIVSYAVVYVGSGVGYAFCLEEQVCSFWFPPLIHTHSQRYKPDQVSSQDITDTTGAGLLLAID